MINKLSGLVIITAFPFLFNLPLITRFHTWVFLPFVKRLSANLQSLIKDSYTTATPQLYIYITTFAYRMYSRFDLKTAITDWAKKENVVMR